MIPFGCGVAALGLSVSHYNLFLAEGVGFEPTSPFGETVFKTAAIDHSATPPLARTLGSSALVHGGAKGQVFSLPDPPLRVNHELGPNQGSPRPVSRISVEILAGKTLL